MTSLEKARRLKSTLSSLWNFFLWTALAISRKLMIPRRTLSASAQTLVCSPGGVATTTTMLHLKKFSEINDATDQDNLKHLPRPNLEASRIVFIFGDPIMVYESIKRRGWLRHQSAKLGSLGGLLFFGEIQKKCFLRAVEKQYDSYRVEENSGRVLMVEWDELWNRKAEITAFLGIDDIDCLSTWPQRRRRHWETFSSELTSKT